MTADRSPAPQLQLIDVLKVVAAQCIVFHHFSAYGPLSEAASADWPELFEWLYDKARMAVQVFLVIAGFLAARSLSLNRHTFGSMTAGLWQRYLRLVFPFVVALLITMLCSAVARPFLDAEVVPTAPSVAGFLAHASLLHSMLDVESISAGVWYVAIDFQLYAALALLLWGGRGKPWLSMGLVALLSVASMGWFNTDASWDVWALYFFGAYGLGALAWWAGLRGRQGFLPVALYAATLTAGLVSLTLEFRERLALGIGVSALLVSFGANQWQLPQPANRWAAHFSRTSYALFLTHYAVLLLANTAWAALGWTNGDAALVFIGASWVMALGTSHLFYMHVEKRIEQFRSSIRQARAPQAAK